MAAASLPFGAVEEVEHVPRERRLEILLRMLPTTRTDACEARPDLWPTEGHGRKRIEKDLGVLKARGCYVVGHVWHPPRPPPPDPAADAVRRARRFVGESRPVLPQDAAVLLALAEGRGRPVGCRLLREWMDREGLTLRTAAKRIGVSNVTVHRWLQGHRVPRGAMVKRIEQRTGVPAAAWRQREPLPKNGSTPEDA